MTLRFDKPAGLKTRECSFYLRCRSHFRISGPKRSRPDVHLHSPYCLAKWPLRHHLLSCSPLARSSQFDIVVKCAYNPLVEFNRYLLHGGLGSGAGHR